MTVIKGTITDATGQPLAGATITFTALENTAGMLRSVATYITTVRGEYEFTVTPGVYSVSLAQNGTNGYALGAVHIYDDSPDGTLNSFLNAKNTDTRPEALKQFEALAQQTQDNASKAAQVLEDAINALIKGEKGDMGEQGPQGIPGPAGPAGPAGTVTPSKLITPTADVSRYFAQTDKTPGNQDWKVTEGAAIFSPWTFYPTRTSEKWEIQHPMPGPESLFSNTATLTFKFIANTATAADAEGKDIMEVRLVIPDNAVPPGISIPQATPDKPYLVMGFILRCVTGIVTMYPLDTDITSTAGKQVSAYSPGYSGDFRVDIDRGRLYINSGSGYLGRMTLSRTGVNTPVNTLCIRSGVNPIKEVGFDYLESFILREKLHYTLTPEDANATVYAPWQCLSDNDTRLIIPDTPFPEGFCVNLVSDGLSSVSISSEGDVTISEPAWGSVITRTVAVSGGKKQLIQIGKNGKTWLLY